MNVKQYEIKTFNKILKVSWKSYHQAIDNGDYMKHFIKISIKQNENTP